MKKAIKIFILLFLLLVSVSCNLTAQKTVENSNATAEIGQTVKVTINYGDSQQVFSAKVTEPTTALEILKQVAASNSLVLETKTYDFGVSLEKLGAKQGGVDNYYWLYNYNGAPAQVGIDQQLVKPGESLEFIYSRS